MKKSVKQLKKLIGRSFEFQEICESLFAEIEDNGHKKWTEVNWSEAASPDHGYLHWSMSEAELLFAKIRENWTPGEFARLMKAENINAIKDVLFGRDRFVAVPIA